MAGDISNVAGSERLDDVSSDENDVEVQCLDDSQSDASQILVLKDGSSMAGPGTANTSMASISMANVSMASVSMAQPESDDSVHNPLMTSASSANAGK